MKSLMRVVVLVGWAVTCGWAAEADVAGLWKNTAMGIGQSVIIVSQEGADLHVAGYGVWAEFVTDRSKAGHSPGRSTTGR